MTVLLSIVISELLIFRYFELTYQVKAQPATSNVDECLSRKMVDSLMLDRQEFHLIEIDIYIKFISKRSLKIFYRIRGYLYLKYIHNNSKVFFIQAGNFRNCNIYLKTNLYELLHSSSISNYVFGSLTSFPRVHVRTPGE